MAKQIYYSYGYEQDWYCVNDIHYAVEYEGDYSNPRYRVDDINDWSAFVGDYVSTDEFLWEELSISGLEVRIVDGYYIITTQDHVVGNGIYRDYCWEFTLDGELYSCGFEEYNGGATLKRVTISNYTELVNAPDWFDINNFQ